MKVSVIICNYNYGDLLAQSVDSALRQTYGNCEIIVVDDGSTDSSRKIMDGFLDSRLRTIFKPNGGQASAFNAGFEVATGDIVAFLDSDDWWKPDKIETVVRWHDFLKGEYGLIQHALEVWDNGQTYSFKPALRSGNCFEEMRRTGDINFFVGTSGLVFRKNVLDDVFPVPEELRICADAYLTRTSFTYGPVYSIPTPLGYYRKHRNNVLNNDRFNNINFNHDLLFPALNRFYERKGLEFRFEPPAPKPGSRSDAHVPLPAELLRAYVRKTWECFERDCGNLERLRVAVFGAGKHSIWLEQATADLTGPEVVAVLDDVANGQRLWGLKPVRPDKWNPSEADAIVLSTDCITDTMRERCRQLYGDNVKTIDLYAGLPPGPYPKC